MCECIQLYERYACVLRTKLLHTRTVYESIYTYFKPEEKTRILALYTVQMSRYVRAHYLLSSDNMIYPQS